MLSDRMMKWQMKLRVERSNLVCIEKRYPNYMYAAVGFLLVVIQEEWFSVHGVNAIRTCQMSRVNIGYDYKRHRKQKRKYYCTVMLPLSGVLCVAVVSFLLLWKVYRGPGNSTEGAPK